MIEQWTGGGEEHPIKKKQYPKNIAGDIYKQYCFDAGVNSLVELVNNKLDSENKEHHEARFRAATEQLVLHAYGFTNSLRQFAPDEELHLDEIIKEKEEMEDERCRLMSWVMLHEAHNRGLIHASVIDKARIQLQQGSDLVNKKGINEAMFHQEYETLNHETWSKEQVRAYHEQFHRGRISEFGKDMIIHLPYSAAISTGVGVNQMADSKGAGIAAGFATYITLKGGIKGGRRYFANRRQRKKEK